MMLSEHTNLRVSSVENFEFQEILATDLVRRYHQALQLAVLTDDDQMIGRALDALGVAYGVMHDHERTLHYCAIAASILQEVGDREGAAIAVQHTQSAVWMLQQHHNRCHHPEHN